MLKKIMSILILGLLTMQNAFTASHNDATLKILVICVHNSSRSVMLAGYLKKLQPTWQVFSAGLKPTDRVNPLAIKVLAEDGIKMGSHKPQNVSDFLDQSFDYVISVCEAECPIFSGTVKHSLHVPFQDPSSATGNKQEKLKTFRKVRDQIKEYAISFAETVQK